MADPAAPWSLRLTLADIQRATRTLTLEPDEAQRAAIARLLDLEALSALSAEVAVAAWLDGAELKGCWRGVVSQICSVSAQPFDSALEGAFDLRVVPADSPAAEAPGAETVIDPDAPDPPDVLEDETVDIAGYVVEHLALEIDPFPRKPGAQFDPPPPEAPGSPFAALRALKRATPTDDEGGR